MDRKTYEQVLNPHKDKSYVLSQIPKAKTKSQHVEFIYADTINFKKKSNSTAG